METFTIKELVEIIRGTDGFVPMNEEDVIMTLHNLKAKGVLDFKLHPDNETVDIEFFVDLDRMFGNSTLH